LNKQASEAVGMHPEVRVRPSVSSCHHSPGERVSGEILVRNLVETRRYGFPACEQYVPRNQRLAREPLKPVLRYFADRGLGKGEAPLHDEFVANVFAVPLPFQPEWAQRGA